MALVVEDGTGKANAESYVSAADCAAYAVKLGLSFPGGETSELSKCEAALRRATQWIDMTYCQRFKGHRTYPATPQALEWPRYEVWIEALQRYTIIGEIPAAIVSATCEAAIREYATPGCLSKDNDPRGKISSYQAGSVSVSYTTSSASASQFPKIDAILAPLMARSSLVGRAVRG